jgi:hypothetical protein
VDALLQALGVAAIAVVELWAAVPAGLALGLPLPLVWAATLAGALLGITVVVVAGDRLRAWLVDRFGHGGVREGGRLRRVWDRYGVIGWGLLAPLLLGAPLAAAIGVALGAERWRLVLWLGAGAALWTTVLTLAVALGADAVTSWV